MKKQTRIIVRYDFISGEDSTCAEVLISGSGNIRDIIHNKFMEFFVATKCEKKYKTYQSGVSDPYIQIKGWEVVPGKDWKVLKKYLIEI